ncbi:MAG: PilN domain-containing protein [Bacteroidota bacterium]
MRINLLPLEFRPKQQVTFLNIMILLGGIIVLLASIGFGIYEYFNYQDSIQKLALIEQQITFLQPQMEEVRKLEQTQTELLKLQQEIDKIRSFYQPQLEIFNGLAVFMPGNIWLEELSIDPQGKVVVFGQSLNIPLIGNFLNQINHSEYYQSTSLKEIKLEEDDALISYQFNLEMVTGRGSLEYDEKK